MIHRESDGVRSAFYLINTSLPGVGIYARISSRITRLLRLATPVVRHHRLSWGWTPHSSDGPPLDGDRLYLKHPPGEADTHCHLVCELHSWAKEAFRAWLPIVPSRGSVTIPDGFHRRCPIRFPQSDGLLSVAGCPGNLTVSQLWRATRDDSRLPTAITLVYGYPSSRYHQINYNWFNEPFAVSLYNAYT